MFTLLLLYVFFPYSKHIYSSALIIWASKCEFVMSISLTIIKTHEAIFLENMVSSNSIYNLTIAWNSRKVWILFQFLKFLLVFMLIILINFDRIQFFSQFFFYNPRWIRLSFNKWYSHKSFHLMHINIFFLLRSFRFLFILLIAFRRIFIFLIFILFIFLFKLFISTI